MRKSVKIGLGAVVGVLAIAALVDPPEEQAQRAQQAPPEPPPYLTRLSDEQRSVRVTGCSADLAAWRDRGVVRYGGDRPAIDRDVWSELKEEEKTELFEIAACLQSEGAPGEQFISIGAAGFRSVNLDTRRTPNLHRLPRAGAPPG